MPNWSGVRPGHNLVDLVDVDVAFEEGGAEGAEGPGRAPLGEPWGGGKLGETKKRHI